MGRVIKLIFYYLAYSYGIAILFSAGYMFTHHTYDFTAASADPDYVFLAMMAQVLGTVAVTLHLLCWKYVKRDQLTLHFPRVNRVLLTSVVFIIGMGWWTNYLSEWMRLPDNLEAVYHMIMNHPLGIFATVIMAPLMEELFFRGAIQGHLMRKWKNPIWAIVVSSLLFGVIHGNPVQIFFAFLTGLALGWMYYRTGSLLPGMLMHFVNNGCATLLYHLAGGKNETMVEAYGATGAVCLALVGVALTAWSIWYIKTRLIPNRIAWKETPAPEEEVIASENKEQA